MAIVDRGLHRYSSRVLAGRIRQRRNQTSGVRFLRRTKQLPEKVIARNKVLAGFTLRAFPKVLAILTFPSLFWGFEKQLLRMREGGRWEEKLPRDTYITAIERDEAVYRASLQYIPMPKEGFLNFKDSPEYATSSVRTRHIHRYHKCEFEALTQSPWPTPTAFSGAWLDFNGPLSLEKLQGISRFLNTQCREYARVALTFANARYSQEMMEFLKQFESREQAIRKAIELAAPDKSFSWLFCYRYQEGEGMPMLHMMADISD